VVTVRGRFLTLEGLEGVGKTTNLEFIQSELNRSGIKLVVSREPGGTALGEQLRHTLLHADVPVSAEAELLMMAASRKQHLVEVVQPALDRGDWVLSDRYSDASFAYQGGGRKLGLELVEQLHQLMRIDEIPDLTILLDMSIDEGLKRMAQRGKPDRIEQEEKAFFERARAAYLERAKSQPGRIRVVDASLPLADVQAEIKGHLQQLLSDHHV